MKWRKKVVTQSKTLPIIIKDFINWSIPATRNEDIHFIRKLFTIQSEENQAMWKWAKKIQQKWIVYIHSIWVLVIHWETLIRWLLTGAVTKRICAVDSWWISQWKPIKQQSTTFFGWLVDWLTIDPDTSNKNSQQSNPQYVY